MSLDERFAYWIDLGLTHYGETYKLQQSLADLRKKDIIPDIILTTQHYPVVNFGTDEPNNLFSDSFLAEVSRRGELSDHNFRMVLAERGIEFERTKRGGGVTFLAPGQLVYYPIVNVKQLTGKELDVGGYKSRIYQVLFNSLKDIGISEIKIPSPESLKTRGERRDVWIQDDSGKSLKMGSKGIRFDGNVAYHGFVLYIDELGLKNFDIINPCGYTHDEVSVTSVESYLGKKIPHEKVHNIVKEQIRQKFGYSYIKEIPNQLLYEKSKLQEVSQYA
jgi:lipoyl(octanoyl) transferase